jgi:hypothetical protein
LWKLLVVADGADLVADLGGEAHLLHGIGGGAGARPHVRDLGDLSLPRGGGQFLADGLAVLVLHLLQALADQGGICAVSRVDAVRPAAERVQVAILEAALSLRDLREGSGHVGLQSGDRLVEHCLRLGCRAEVGRERMTGKSQTQHYEH